LNEIPDGGARLARLCELNVIEQVMNVCQTPIVQQAWEQGQELTVHGLVYGLNDGLLRELGLFVSRAEELLESYTTAVASCVQPPNA
jgi:carbonic anhydrase